jgi:hypothetical protein
MSWCWRALGFMTLLALAVWLVNRSRQKRGECTFCGGRYGAHRAGCRTRSGEW